MRRTFIGHSSDNEDSSNGVFKSSSQCHGVAMSD